MSDDYYGPPPSNRSTSNRAAAEQDDRMKRGYQQHYEAERGYPDSRNGKRSRGGRDNRGGGRRDDDDRYYHREGGDHYSNQDEWQCLECSSWNYGQDYDCTRCGTPSIKKSAHRRTHDDDARWMEDERNRLSPSEPEKKKSFAEELDEFGRAVARAMPPQKKKKEDPVWPPCFDKNGSAFVFDTRSGMFYEAETDFFFDPVSKLYYGNKQGCYYRYDTGKKAFEHVQKVNPTQAEDAIMDTIAKPSTADSGTKGNKKAAISIKLKTKALSSAKPSKKSKTKTKAPTAAAAATASVPLVTKKHAADIDKWSERQVEKRQQEEQAPLPTPSEDTTKTIATTAKGEPICLLCRRKFATLAKLEYHEKVSNLHKENLAKQKKNKEEEETKVPPQPSSQPQPPAAAYVDRAQQRRTLYGPESTVVTAAPSDLHSVVSLGSSTAAATASVGAVQPQDNLGESNIGNQMLKKLGWKHGAALGRKAKPDGTGGGDGTTSDTDNDTTTSELPRSHPPAAAAVKQDWEKIESLASRGGKGRPSSGGIGSHRIG